MSHKVILQLTVDLEFTDKSLDLTPIRGCGTVLELAKYYQTMLAEDAVSVESLMNEAYGVDVTATVLDLGEEDDE